MNKKKLHKYIIGFNDSLEALVFDNDLDYPTK